MAINPLQLPDTVRQSSIDWSPLARLGDVYGRYQDKQKIRSAIEQSKDANGNLNFERAAANLASLGYTDEARGFLGAAAAQGNLAVHQGVLDLNRKKFDENMRATRAGEEAARRLIEGPGPQSSSSAPGNVATVRNNNPGGMWPGPSSASYGATGYQNIAGGNKIATFPDAESGAAAHFDLLNRNYTGMTLANAISKWSNAKGSDLSGYIYRVSRETGLRPDTLITPELLQSAKGIDLTRSMARVESNGEFPLSEQGWSNAQARVFGRPAPVPATPIGTRVASLSELPPSGELPQVAPQQPLQQTAQAQPQQPQNARDARIQWLQQGLEQPNLPESVRKAAQSQLDRLLKERDTEAAPARKAAETRATETAKAEVKSQANAQKDQKQAQSVTDTLDEFISLAKEIRDDKELYRSTGAVGKLYSRPGGAASQLDAKIETLKAQAAVNALQSMRDSSKTGGAVGQVTQGEYPILASKFGPISYPTNFDAAGYKKVLDAAISQAEKTKRRLSGSFGVQIPDRVRQNGHVYEKQPDGSYKAVE